MATKAQKTGIVGRRTNQLEAERLAACLKNAADRIKLAKHYTADAKTTFDRLCLADENLSAASQSILTAASMVRRLSKTPIDTKPSPLWTQGKIVTVGSRLARRKSGRARLDKRQSKIRKATRLHRA